MTSYIISVSRREKVNYISSPEVSFLTSLLGRVHPRTKLVFRFLDAPSVESSMNVTYHSLILNNLTFIKTFASGIIVPKHFIWPVSDDNYLEECSSVVRDAHDLGLEIYADDFANDLVLGYNYSYDPLAEYLSFIDNNAFSVDGVLTDHPITASEAIGEPLFFALSNSLSEYYCVMTNWAIMTGIKQLFRGLLFLIRTPASTLNYLPDRTQIRLVSTLFDYYWAYIAGEVQTYLHLQHHEPRLNWY